MDALQNPGGLEAEPMKAALREISSKVSGLFTALSELAGLVQDAQLAEEDPAVLTVLQEIPHRTENGLKALSNIRKSVQNLTPGLRGILNAGSALAALEEGNAGKGDPE